MRNRSDKFKYKIAQYMGDIPKPKKNEIIITPTDNRLMEIAPYLASDVLPSWWKDLPVHKGSLRRCQGTYDFLQYGFILPLWMDVTIRPRSGKDGFEFNNTDYGDNSFPIGGFPQSSAAGCPFGDNRKMPQADFPKLVSPWRYRTPPGVSLMVLPILHEPNPNYTIMPGLVHTDFYNQIHIVMSIFTDKEFTIPAGTPMQHIIPIRRDSNIKRIVWGNESFSKFMNGNGMGVGALATSDNSQLYRKMQKQYDDMSDFNKK